jgi:hypothetical protein
MNTAGPLVGIYRVARSAMSGWTGIYIFLGAFLGRKEDILPFRQQDAITPVALYFKNHIKTVSHIPV